MDVLRKIREGGYRNAVPYTIERPVIDETTTTVRQAKLDMAKYESDKRAQRAAHRNEESRLRDVLKRDLEEEFGLSGNVKADSLFGIAWEEEHSGGYEEVAICYERFSVLVTS